MTTASIPTCPAPSRAYQPSPRPLERVVRRIAVMMLLWSRRRTVSRMHTHELQARRVSMQRMLDARERDHRARPVARSI